VQTQIAAVDYPAQALAVPATPAHEAAFAADRTLRIHNPGRSGLYRIVGRRREADRLWVTLDHSALLARERVTGVRENQVVLGAMAPVSPATAERPRASWVTGQSVLTFAGGGLDKDGHFSGHCAFAGAWVGEGAAARRLRGATRSGTLILDEGAEAHTPQDDLNGKVVSVWEYGPGDQVEVALVQP
jgi:hypothetical protein